MLLQLKLQRFVIDESINYIIGMAEVAICYLVNNSTEDFVVSPGDRVAQFMVVPYPTMILEEGIVEDSGRGAGIGSSGVK